MKRVFIQIFISLTSVHLGSKAQQISDSLLLDATTIDLIKPRAEKNKAIAASKETAIHINSKNVLKTRSELSSCVK